MTVRNYTATKLSKQRKETQLQAGIYKSFITYTCPFICLSSSAVIKFWSLNSWLSHIATKLPLSVVRKLRCLWHW